MVVDESSVIIVHSRVQLFAIDKLSYSHSESLDNLSRSYNKIKRIRPNTRVTYLKRGTNDQFHPPVDSS